MENANVTLGLKQNNEAHKVIYSNTNTNTTTNTSTATTNTSGTTGNANEIVDTPNIPQPATSKAHQQLIELLDWD